MSFAWEKKKQTVSILVTDNADYLYRLVSAQPAQSLADEYPSLNGFDCWWSEVRRSKAPDS